MQSWYTPAVWSKFPGYPALITSEYAVKVYGQGHVVAYNYVANWHDGIDIATYGDPDGTPDPIPDRVPVSIDIYNNDIYNMADNCIEADGGAHNIRVFRNRCFNSAGGAFSAQPIFGGPLYFYQNVAYDTTTGGPEIRRHARGSTRLPEHILRPGPLIGPASNVHFRNNLILGDGYPDPVFNLRTSTNYSTSDYNGFRPNPGVDNAFEWDSPPFQSPPITRANSGPAVQDAEGIQRGTKQDQHSVLVDYDIFANVGIPDKSDPQHLYKPEDFDFRLKPGSAAIEQARRFPRSPTISPAKHPTFGALELDRPVPHYGPRDAGDSK